MLLTRLTRLLLAWAALATVVAAADASCNGNSCDESVSLLQSELSMEEAPAHTTANIAASLAHAKKVAAHAPAPASAPAPAPASAKKAAAVAPAPAPAPVAAEKRNAAAKEPVPPVSCTMKCVTCLTLQFFAIYTALAITRTVRTLSAYGSNTAESILQGAVKTMNYAPMCAVLFLATRMRANLLTGSEPDKYNLPQPWAKRAMVITTISVALATVLHLLTEIAKAAGRSEAAVGTGAKVLDMVRYLILPGLYFGSGTVTVGLMTMERPKELSDKGEVEVSDAAYCTVLLTVLYFVVHLGVQIGGTVDTWMKKAGQPIPFLGKLSLVLETACTTVYFCPMLAILFMCADMRAHQLTVDPQDWARTWFYITVWALLGQTFVSVCVPMLMDATVTPGELDGELLVKVDSAATLSVLAAARWLLNAGLYVGMFSVVTSIVTIEAPEGEVTIPLSTTSKCVVMMTTQYLFVFFFLWLLLTLRDFGFNQLNFMLSIMTAAKETVMFAPMLGVLFLGTRVRALQLTKNTGAPQPWVQNCMVCAANALLVQILMVIVTGIVSGKPASLEPSKVNADHGNMGATIVAYCTTALQYVCMFGMYGGAVGVMLGLFQMTPENAAATE